MKRILTITGVVIGGLLLVILLAATALYLSTAGDYQIPATVNEDPSLPSLEIDGYTFHAETFGSPENPVVIVLHGGPGGDYRSLLGLQELANQYFLVFYDQRGAGLSARVPAEQLTYQSSLQDLDNFVDLYGRGQPVSLIGHSWGGMLASGYLGYAPEKVNKAILAEPGFLNAQEAQDWREQQNTYLGDLNFLWFALRSGFEAQHVSGPDSDASQDYLIGQIVHYFANHPDNPYHCPGIEYSAPGWRWGSTAGNAIQASATTAELDSLSAHAWEYNKPVLFLAGACDTWIGPELQTRHAKLYPNARLVVIPEAGHDMFWDNPQATLTAIRDFLAE
jgi:proline iminopeptidase